MDRNIIKLLIIISIASCQDTSQKNAIRKTNDIRHEVGLLPIRENLKIDSTFKFIGDTGLFLRVRKRIKDTDNLSEFYLGTYYSDKKSSFNKRIFFKSKSEKLIVVEEEDKFHKRVNDYINCSIVLTHNYQNNTTLYRIDSLPTEKFKRINEEKLQHELKTARDLGMWICGTSANEILTNGFPKWTTKISKNQYLKLRDAFH